MFDCDHSLEIELREAVENGTFNIYMERALGEAALYRYGERVNWDREKMIAYLLAGPSGHLGRKCFEKALDSGKTKEMAKVYHDTLVSYHFEGAGS